MHILRQYERQTATIIAPAVAIIEKKIVIHTNLNSHVMKNSTKFSSVQMDRIASHEIYTNKRINAHAYAHLQYSNDKQLNEH